MKNTMTLAIAMLGVYTLSASGPADLSGSWTGKRYQYQWNSREYAREYQYQFEIKQEGNRITGSTSILDEKGQYADMELRGMLVGDVLYFEEYAVKNQSKEADLVWCYKIGKLQLKQESGKWTLQGATPSYMSDYYYPCSGGFTQISKAVEEHQAVLPTLPASGSATASDFTVYPNPFRSETFLRLSMEEPGEVEVSIMDLGGRIAHQQTFHQEIKGMFYWNLNREQIKLQPGAYVVMVKAGGKNYSQEIIVME